MAKRVLVPLAEGFEEIEAITIVDVLRRAGVEVQVAGLTEGPVKGSRNIVVVPDTTMAEAAGDEHDAVVLPGGGPGSERLSKDPRVKQALERAAADGRLVAAICAAPAVVLLPLGLLEGRRSTCFPFFADRVPGFVPEKVVVDGNLITSQGPGTAFEFALTLVTELVGAEKSAEVRAAALA